MKTKLSSILFHVLLAVTFVLLSRAIWLVYMVVPNERIMGAIQRIFYFHVGSAIACYCAVFTIFICSFLHLYKRSIKADIVSESAAEVGFLFCTIVLVTGMIWAKSAWNTWFNWEPRLVSFIILWLIFLALNFIRSFGEPSKVASHSAVLGILAASTVPMIIISVKMLPQSAQLHPQVVERGGLKDPLFVGAFRSSVFALVLLQFVLIWLRARLGILKARLEA